MKTIISGYTIQQIQDNFSIRNSKTNEIIFVQNTTTTDKETFKLIECIQTLVSHVIYYKETTRMS